MEQVKIYLSGGMTGLSMDEQIGWRNKLIDAIKFGDVEPMKHPVFFNPPDYYSPNTYEHKSEREAMEFELYHLRNSDLVVVNFNAPNSIGTAMELILAKERHIPVIGLNKNKEVSIHPWLLECCTRMCGDMYELVSHIVNFYLN